MIRKDNRSALITIETLALLMAVVCLLPFYFLLSNSFKPYKEIALNPIAFPKMLYLENYIGIKPTFRFGSILSRSG